MAGINDKDDLHRRTLQIEAKEKEPVDMLLKNNVDTSDTGIPPSLNLTISKDAEIDCKDKTGRTALHIAIANHDIETVKILLENNADVNISNSSGETPLYLALINERYEIVQCLIQYDPKADVEPKDGNILILLECAVEKGYTDIDEYLLKRGGNVNKALREACCKKDHELVKMLIPYGVDINVKNINGENALHISIEKNDIETVKILLENNADVNIPYPNGETPLYHAVINGHHEIAQCLIQYDPKVDVTRFKPKYGNTLLECAVRKGYRDIVKYLLKRGGNVNEALQIACRNKDHELVKMLIPYCDDINVKILHGENALQISIAQNDIETVKILLENNADVNITYPGGLTPLHHAVINGRHQIAQCLIQYKPKSDVKYRSGNARVLGYAVRKGYTDIVKYLLENGANVNEALQDAYQKNDHELVKMLIPYFNEKNINGENVLHISIKNNDVETVKILLENNADVNIPYHSGETPLYLAVKNGHHEIAQCLIQYKPKIDVESRDGITLLECAVEKGYTDIVKYLLELGAKVNRALGTAYWKKNYEIIKMLIPYCDDINVEEIEGEYALYKSIQDNDIETVKILLENNADVNMSDSYSGETPLYYAVINKHHEIAQCLIQYHNNADVGRTDRMTLLQCAARRGYTDIVKYLLERGANVNTHKKFYYNGYPQYHTALHFACERNYHEIVDMLMVYGADMNLKSAEGKTALHIAVEKKYPKCVESLLKKRTTK